MIQTSDISPHLGGWPALGQLAQHCVGRQNRLMGLRQKCSKDRYPALVLRNVFLELYPHGQLWHGLDGAFCGKQTAASYADAYKSVELAYNRIRESSQSHVERLMDAHTLCVAGISYVEVLPTMEKASAGDNTCAEELEFFYHVHTMISEMLINWHACGPLGLTREEGFLEIWGLTLEDTRLTSFEQAIESFTALSELAIGGCFDQDGNQKTPILYLPLPSLWEDSPPSSFKYCQGRVVAGWLKDPVSPN